MDDQITDRDIQALVDGELGWEDTQRVRNYLALNPIALQRYQELLDQNHLISEWWQQQKVHQH